ncbi:MAG: tetratricopeptide repeat protein [Bdellovibrionales bacterium]
MNSDETLNAALVAQANEHFDDAERLYWDVLKDRPNDPLALHNIGTLRFRSGDYKGASDMISKSIAANNNAPEAFSNLGLALAAQRRMDEALTAYNKAITLRPQNPETYNHIAVALMDQGDLDGAVAACRNAISQQREFPLAYYNLGVALQRQGKQAEAAAAFRDAISYFPAFPEAYCNMGLAFMSLGKRDEAIDAYKKAIELRPNFPEALNNLGQPLNEVGRLDEAAEAYKKATIFRPTYSDAYVNLAHTLRKNGQLGGAIQACRDSLKAVPTHAKSQIELINLLRQACDWRNYDADMRQMLSMIQDVEPFIILAAPSMLTEQLHCAQKWASRYGKVEPMVHDRSRQPYRLRIGYLSSDFHLHATAFLMAELFERHDRSRFEIFGYSYDRDDGSDIRKRLIKGFDHFVDFHSMPGDQAVSRIYNDKIDILVDLKGYTSGARTEIMACRPAPIQVNYVGFPGTMGADFIDYIIGDPYVTPMKDQEHYAEKIVQLPHCYQPNDSKRAISSFMQSRADCGLPETGFVFCCFNASFKITPPFFNVWMRLLNAVPGSVLWLMGIQSEVEPNLRREAQAQGVDPNRLVFARAIPLEHHLSRHRHADLFLDTLPYGAHTTASDALWAGLPLLTCTGETFAGRVGTSALQAVGMPELIAKSLDEYEDRALELATNPEKLKQIKQKLQNNIKSAPLFDIAQYTRDLETAYKQMWDTWASGGSPKPFAVGKP